MIINHNLGAMNANRNMGINATNANKSMEKLSSGLRINKAGDDAAGLAISEKMRGQIRGLDQSSANAQDGISMIQTAEGALSETTSIVQRLRELSVQSSSDTNNADDRVAVQKEVVQLKAEIDRIGNTTEFNTTKLVDGSIGAKKAPGTDNAAVISSDIGAATAGEATASGVQNKATLATYTGTTASLSVDGANITINHAAADYTKFALVGAVDSTGFAAKLQTDINDSIDVYNKTNNKTIDHVAVSTSAATDGIISITSGSTGSASDVSITSGTTGITNFWEKATSVTAAATVGTTGVAGKFDAAGAANAAAITGTEASTGTLTFASTDTLTVNGTRAVGEAGNIAIEATTVGAVADVAATFVNGKLSIVMGSTPANNTAANIQAKIQALGTVGGVDFSAFTVSGTGDFANATGETGAIQAGTMAGGGDAKADTSIATIDGKAINVTWSKVGANDPAKDDSMVTYASNVETDINNSIAKYNLTVPATEKVENVKVSVKDGAFVIQSGSTKATSSIKFDNSEAAKSLGLAGQSSATQGGGVDFQIGANAGQTMKITVADMRTAALGIADIDMSTKEGAQAATSLLDTALKTVSGQRADLGAFSNRLEHTIANLGTSSENLTSAEARIRDVDMAKEMSTFSKNNILNQAAQAMLAQANQQPQQVLALLR